jgi:peptidoglycan/xylan/chitin deacetylase (PgdA/CDA1 family)
MGYKAIGWSLRSLDTVLKDKAKLTERVIERLHPGAVILMHDDREITGLVLEDIILKIKEEGYRIVGLEEMMEVKV